MRFANETMETGDADVKVILSLAGEGLDAKERWLDGGGGDLGIERSRRCKHGEEALFQQTK